ncbi:MAG: DUF4838 domain-containing protein [Abditibacteriota bacterium]|nr:DUF4838 domain-containing protein [Abditibacteriota bacterium]
MKKLLFFLIIFLISTSIFAFDLIKDGQPNATVVISNDMTAPEVNAANEFIDYIEKITSVKLEKAGAPTEGNNIYFGQTQAVKDITGYDFSKLSGDGIYIKSGDDYLIFAGDRPRGTLYAVYTYLEDFLGCRFFSADKEIVPQKNNITINNINKIYVPPFMSRESFFKVNLISDHYKFYVKNKLNGNFNNIPDDWGGHVSLIGWCHTIPFWIPASKYGQDHPEWFALVKGHRENDKDDANICFSNQEVIDEMTKVVLEQLGDTQEKVIVSVSQADTYRKCECEECQKLYEKYGNSGALLTVVNHVAREVKKKNPNALVETLAYQWTRQAPKNIKPEDNVIIRLCDIECDFASPLDSRNNKSFYKDLKDWHKFTDSVYIWDYVVNFQNSHPVFPDFHVLKKNMNIFANNHGIAVFAEGDDFNWDTALISLKAYLIGKLMWDPSANQDKLTKEYLNFYFGPAGNDVYDYLKIITKATQREKPFLRCFNEGNTFLNENDYKKAFRALYAGYNKVKEDDKYRERLLVQLYSLHFSVWQAPEKVQKKVIDSGLLGIYDTREKFLKMYIPFSFAHNNSYGQYTVHINDSKYYKY